MCRPNRICLTRRWLLAAVFVSLVVAPVARADEVAAYLQRHQLKQLLAVYLQDQLADLTGAQLEGAIIDLLPSSPGAEPKVDTLSRVAAKPGPDPRE